MAQPKPRFLQRTAAAPALLLFTLIGAFVLSGCGGGSTMPTRAPMNDGGGQDIGSTQPPLTHRRYQGLWGTWLNRLPNTTRVEALDEFWMAADAKPQGTTILQTGVTGTTQSSYAATGQTQDKTLFTTEYDESGQLHFTRTRIVGSTTSISSTIDPAVPFYRLDGNVAPDWKGVETRVEQPTALVGWDAFSDRDNADDTDYLTIGYWKIAFKDPDSGAFTGLTTVGVAATGTEPFNNDNIAGLTGTANYEGPATGVITLKRDVGDFFYTWKTYFFNATAILEVNFGDTSALGTISGRITDGALDDPKPPYLPIPVITLEPAEIFQASGGGHGGDLSGETSGATMKGEAVSGKWGGKFFGNGASATDHPDSVAGTFGARTPNNRQLSVELHRMSIIGAFGANRQ